MNTITKTDLLTTGAETLFRRGSRRLKTICIPSGNTPGFQPIGQADHGFKVERNGDLFAISSHRVRSGGPYRTAVLVRMKDNGRFRVLERYEAESFLPELPPSQEFSTPTEKPEIKFTGELKAHFQPQRTTH